RTRPGQRAARQRWRHPHRRARRDRALGDSHRDRGRSRAPEAVHPTDVALRALSAVAGRLPPAAAAWIGRRLGDLAYALTPGRRRIALANLGQAFPDTPLWTRRRLCRASYQHLGMMV